MTQTLNMSKEIVGLIDEMGTIVKYYEGRLSSDVAMHSGTFDYQDSDTLGFYYKSPVEYRLLRSGINYRSITEKAGQILQGGCSMTIARKLKNHHAVLTSNKAITTVDLSSEKNITLKTDGGTKTTIDCSVNAANVSAVTLAEIIHNLNTAGLGEIAYESGSDGDPMETGYVTIRSIKTGNNSIIELHPSDSNDAQYDILGIPETGQIQTYIPSKSHFQYLDVYNKVSRGDVFVVNKRMRREGEILKRGVEDTLSAFDVKRVLSVAKGDTVYKKGIDYSLSGITINWLSGGNSPADGDYYTVEYLCKANYIVYNELAADRGTDDDEIPKRIHLALRQYSNTQPLPID